MSSPLARLRPAVYPPRMPALRCRKSQRTAKPEWQIRLGDFLPTSACPRSNVPRGDYFCTQFIRRPMSELGRSSAIVPETAILMVPVRISANLLNLSQLSDRPGARQVAYAIRDFTYWPTPLPRVQPWQSRKSVRDRMSTRITSGMSAIRRHSEAMLPSTSKATTMCSPRSPFSQPRQDASTDWPTNNSSNSIRSRTNIKYRPNMRRFPSNRFDPIRTSWRRRPDVS